MRSASSLSDWSLRTWAPGLILHPNLAYKTTFADLTQTTLSAHFHIFLNIQQSNHQFVSDAEIFGDGPVAVLLDDGRRRTHFLCSFRFDFRFRFRPHEQSTTRQRFPPLAVGHGQRIRKKDICRPSGVLAGLRQRWRFDDLAGGAVGEEFADRRNPPEEIRRCRR